MTNDTDSTEEWRPVAGWLGWYEVSSLGRVRSVGRVTTFLRGGKPTSMTKPSRLITPALDSGREPAIWLCMGGFIKKAAVDELICVAFHGPKPDGEEVRHLDGNKYNNHASNLEWWDGIDPIKGEEWRDVIGFEGSYRVSNIGRVLTVSRISPKGRIKGRIMNAKPTSGGYLCITLYRDGRGHRQAIHHLVCAAFHGSRPTSQYQVRHLNGNPTDNRAENLAWGTAAENAHDKHAHGTMRHGEAHHCSKLTVDAVREARRRFKNGEKIISLAKFYQVSGTTMARAIKGVGWAHVT